LLGGKGASWFATGFLGDCEIDGGGGGKKELFVPELKTGAVLVTTDGAAVSVTTVFPFASRVATRIFPSLVISTFFGGTYSPVDETVPAVPEGI
jgi:hypothetical protein